MLDAQTIAILFGSGLLTGLYLGERLQNYLKSLKPGYIKKTCNICNTYDHFFIVLQVIFLINLILTGLYLINQVEGELESQCCQHVKKMVEVYGLSGAWIQGKSIDYPENNFQNNNPFKLYTENESKEII